jgi:glycosyltransferase involved in cell wall biosynthesis
MVIPPAVPADVARIAFLIPNLAGGGAERVALTVAGALAERGHEMDLVVMEKRGELIDVVPPGIRLFDLKAPRVRNAFRPLVRYLRERRPDAIQISMWPLTFIGVVATRLSGLKVRCAVSDHSVLSDHHPRSRHPFMSASIRLSYPLADARIAVSRGAADDLVRLSGLQRSSLQVISNPVEFPAKLERRPEIDALWGTAKKRILTVGTLKPDKDHPLLIRAFAKLPKKLNAGLIIAGDGPWRAQLEKLADEEGVADRIVFPGYVADPWPLYASADLFALSSRQESFGIVLVEALYAGLPIVSTDNVGAREVLDSGKWGRLVPGRDPAAFADAMVKALDERPVSGARERALALSGTPSIEQYESLLLGGIAA